MGEIVPINCRQIGMRCTSRLPYIALPSFAGALISGALGSLPGLFAFSLATGATVGVWRRDRIRCWSGHIDNGAPDCEDMHAHIAGPPRGDIAYGEHIVEFAWYLSLNRRDSSTRVCYIIPGNALHEFGSATTFRERQAIAARVARKVILDPTPAN